MPDLRATLIVVCGAPASGKTTLARQLARDLRLPLLEKDLIKESLAESLGATDLAASRRIGEASFRLLHDLAAAMLDRGVDVMIEANLSRPHADAALATLAERARVLLIQCEATPETIIRRYRERADSGARHASHLDRARLPVLRDLLERRAHDLIPLGYDVVAVGTEDGCHPDYKAILDRVRRVRRAR